jgi:hypothetical protein
MIKIYNAVDLLWKNTKKAIRFIRPNSSARIVG